MTRCVRCGDVVTKVPHTRSDASECDGSRRRSSEPGAWDAFHALTAEARKLDVGAVMAGRPLTREALEAAAARSVSDEALRVGHENAAVALAAAEHLAHTAAPDAEKP